MKVHLFGVLAELAGTDLIKVDARSTSAIREELHERIEQLDRMNFSIAVDRQIVHRDIPLNGNEEIALLPPFAGG